MRTLILTAALFSTACQSDADAPGQADATADAAVDAMVDAQVEIFEPLYARATATCFDEGWFISLDVYWNDPGCLTDGLGSSHRLSLPLAYLNGGQARVPEDASIQFSESAGLSGTMTLSPFESNLFDADIKEWDEQRLGDGSADFQIVYEADGSVYRFGGDLIVLACPPNYGHELSPGCEEYPELPVPAQ